MKTTLKHLDHILINYVRGDYQKEAEFINGFLYAFGGQKVVDEVACQGTKALALDPQNPKKSKAFFELHSLNKI